MNLLEFLTRSSGVVFVVRITIVLAKILVSNNDGITTKGK